MYKSVEQWKAEGGVKISQLSGDLPRTERETAIAFIESERYAEVTTAHPRWQKRIEGIGIKPYSITTFEVGEAEIRYYNRVPKKCIKLPTAGTRTDKTARDDSNSEDDDA